MSNSPQLAPNGTVEVATLQEKDGRYFLAVIHVDRNGEVEIVGMDYANMDAAKSAAWEWAQRLKASVLPTRRVRA